MEALVVLLRAYESVVRGRARANLGWYYKYSLFGEKTFEPEIDGPSNFEKVKCWVGGGKRKRTQLEPLDPHQRSTSLSCVKGLAPALLSVGSGTFFNDWTWIDPRELEPSVVSAFIRCVEGLKSVIDSAKRAAEKEDLNEERGDVSVAMNEEAGRFAKAKESGDEQRKAWYGTKDEAPQELVIIGNI